MRAASTGGNSVVGGAVRWWLDELAGLLPRRTERTSRPDFVVAIDGDGYRLAPASSSRAAAGRGEPPLDLAGLQDALTRLAVGRSRPPVGLRLPQSACLVRTVELPVAPADHVERLLGLELERNSPFSPGDVLTAHYPAAGRSTPGKVVHQQLVLKRATIEPAVAAATAAGLPVVRIDCWNDDGSAPLPIDFMPSATQATTPARSPRGLAAIALVASIGLLAFAAVTWLDKQQTALDGLQSRIAVETTKAAAARDALARAQAELAGYTALRRVREAYAPKAPLLEELTRLLPDSVWLTDLRIEGDTVDLTGHAASAASLLTVLERSPSFTDATFTAPVMLDPGADKERFAIRVKLRAANTAAKEGKP